MDLKVLATDLDGTFIPLDDHDDNRRDLSEVQRFLSEHAMELLFVTGRHFASVQDAIAEHRLPSPEWIICDVGTTIMRRVDDAASSNESMQRVQAYHDDLAAIVGPIATTDLMKEFSGIAGSRLQESEKQGAFKLSYYADASHLESILEQFQQKLERIAAPYSIIASVDPFNGDGLIDLLPRGVSKAYALRWWAEHMTVQPEAIVFAGDSGNDLAALTAGYRAIVVHNASDELKQNVTEAHRIAKTDDHVFLASKKATSGVMEGLKHHVTNVR
ncbi:HAD-superfamily hydrolase, subfamily IIB [Rhodopirellula maiorica SM1]|uniref:HAD-superfamily hydrolase, subfamily IIB n=1 Tax=Rhodopirellula maiorica SM1 TaxID=1265738 RepID=M5RLB4_9BACT|nr:HAD-IIB family hydrolase [Rhodopirellula maiorica]EMI16167.1 HAD-superfamily hydrolase, subfamily IIB [Rhodopirellula maiorica SM1]